MSQDSSGLSVENRVIKLNLKSLWDYRYYYNIKDYSIILKYWEKKVNDPKLMAYQELIYFLFLYNQCIVFLVARGGSFQRLRFSLVWAKMTNHRDSEKIALRITGLVQTFNY